MGPPYSETSARERMTIGFECTRATLFSCEDNAMDFQNILDQLLKQGKELANQGREFAEDKLGVPKEGPARTDALNNLGKGAAIGGLAAVLLGTRTGRRMGGKALKYGSIAALAFGAYKAYEAWQQQSGTTNASPAAAPPAHELKGEAANKRSELLLKAMIAAANADGQIDAAERSAIERHLQDLGLSANVQSALAAELNSPQSPESLAAQVDSPAAATEVYVLSASIADETNAKEKDYLARLATALELPPDLVERLGQPA